MEKISNTYKTIVKFEDGIEIKADILNWCLYIPSPRTYWYYSSLDQLLTDLLNLKIKELASNNSQMDIQDLGQAIIQATVWIKKIISPLSTIKTSVQTSLDLQGIPEYTKDD